MSYPWIITILITVVLIFINIYSDIRVKGNSAKITLRDVTDKVVAYITCFAVAVAMDSSFADAATHWKDPIQLIVIIYALINECRYIFNAIRILGLTRLLHLERQTPSVEERVKTLEDEIEKLKKVKPMNFTSEGMSSLMKNWWYLTKSRCRAIELYLGTVAISWGSILLLPSQTLTDLHVYHVMTKVAIEPIWGVIALCIGALEVIAMLMDLYILKRISLLFAVGLWVFVSTAIIVAGWRSTGTAIYPLLAILAMWMYYKVGEQRYGR